MRLWSGSIYQSSSQIGDHSVQPLWQTPELYKPNIPNMKELSIAILLSICKFMICTSKMTRLTWFSIKVEVYSAKEHMMHQKDQAEEIHQEGHL